MAQTVTHTGTKTDCRPKTCPHCGQQDCFERPRFFCGQMLQAEDLVADQRYVIEKNKLHNRYLVGTGVVCGLAVRCDPCDGMITVEPGYAIDCCGNDIVLCEPAKFDVRKYIRDCFGPEDHGCEDVIALAPSPCGELPQEYCLVISYKEEPARPVTAIARGNGCNTNRCEPSRIKETFRLDLVTEDEKPAEKATFWSRAAECLGHVFPVKENSIVKLHFPDGTIRSVVFADELDAALKKNEQGAKHQALYKVFCRLKNHILMLYKKGPNTRCDIAAELREIEETFPASLAQGDETALLPIFNLYFKLLTFLRDCICDALLMPCAPCCDESVLLACLTIKDGKVVKICNTVRTQVITGPALRYYLPPGLAKLGDVLENACCDFEFSRIIPREPGNLPHEPKEPQKPGGTKPQDPAAKQQKSGSESVASFGDGVDGIGLDELGNAVTRAQAALKLVSDYSAFSPATFNLEFLIAPWANPVAGIFQASGISILFSKEKSALDAYGLDYDKANEAIKGGAQNVEVEKVEVATKAEAYSPTNIEQMAWIIGPQSTVQLLVYNGVVTAARMKSS